jgi:hypothetical protein
LSVRQPVAVTRNAGTSETDLCLDARERMSVMDRERPSHFGWIQTYCIRGYPIDCGLRRAYPIERGRRRGSLIAHAYGPASAKRKEALTSVRPRSRELAERASNGTQVRLLWRQGTRQLRVEVREPDRDPTLANPVQPERALDAFHHPYAYASLHGIPVAPESLAICGRQAAGSPHGVP